jgi:hypothetical protein
MNEPKIQAPKVWQLEKAIEKKPTATLALVHKRLYNGVCVLAYVLWIHTLARNPTELKILLQKLINPRVPETFELNQLKSAPSQLLPVFPGFDQLQTCCH